MLALVAAFSAAWLGIYYFYKERLVANKEIWLMAGFKMALLLFYNLISMPFSYLFVIPTIISYPLLLAIITKTDFTKNKTA
jgi:DMSO/TMAO reductase YedYZ heme-binding membrane subunit